MKQLLIILATVFVVGCNTVPTQDSYDIRVPSGLSESDVEQAIAAALDVVKDDDNTWSISTTLTSVSWGKGKRYNWWYPEDFGDGVVYAGYTRKSHYLQVAIHYDSQSIRTEITDSRNLKQSDSRIHKRAEQWVGQLEDRIRMALGKMNKSKAFN